MGIVGLVQDFLKFAFRLIEGSMFQKMVGEEKTQLKIFGLLVDKLFYLIDKVLMHNIRAAKPERKSVEFQCDHQTLMGKKHIGYSETRK